MGMSKLKILQKPDCGRTSLGGILKYDHSSRIFVLLSRGRRHMGVRQVSKLSELTVGNSGVLVSLDLPESVQNHLMHMGFVPNALVTVLRRAPAGDPTVYCVDGLEIALRHETASAIRVRQPERVSAQTPDDQELVEAAQ
jgi:Fe2+ transport system protein FeoA